MAQPEGRPDSERAEARLAELELKVGYLDDLLDTLNRALFRQQQQIERLGQALAELSRQGQGAARAAPGDAREEIPPHY